MLDSLVYEIMTTDQTSATVDVRSVRGTMSWQHIARVSRLVHEEPVPGGIDLSVGADRVGYQERLRRLMRGVAAEAFIALQARHALGAGIDWLLLNMPDTDHAFLFSTRKQERLADSLGSDAGVVRLGTSSAFLLTDRRIAEDDAYCVRLHSFKVFVRFELDSRAARAYMSDFVRTSAGHGGIRVGADEAIHYLRSLTLGLRPSSHTNTIAAKLPPVQGWDIASTRDDSGSPMDIPRPAFPADIRRSLLTRPEPFPPATPANGSEKSLDVPEQCPVCGGKLFHLSAKDAFCSGCDWTNLKPLAPRNPGSGRSQLPSG